jgi:hypothetical protein
MAETEKPSGDIGSIKAPERLPVDTNFKRISKEERRFYEVQTHGLEQDIVERKKYARRIFILCCTWIFVVFALLVAQGLGWLTRFSLSEPVQLAAIGSTTANIIAVFVIVARYLFPDKGHH